MKKIWTLCLVFLLLFSIKVDAKDIGILIDGKAVAFTESTGSPFADENSRTQVPLRVTMESYGALVDWDQSTQTAIVSNNGIVVKVPMGTKYILVNDVKKEIDTKSVVVNSRIYLPIRFVLEAFGANVGWDQANRDVIITSNGKVSELPAYKFDIKKVPVYSGKPYVELNNNVPTFTAAEMKTVSYEKYSNLDSLGRCGVAEACIGVDIMPTTERGSIGQVKPSGWQTIRYDNVDGQYLYNRSHLIGYQLTGENANNKNLITGTRYFNVEGMLPFENKVDDYLEKYKNNHVMYRVTPIFEGNNLVASGVIMEAKSVEDNGKGVSFNVFCYNVQPDIIINYADGTSLSNVANVISMNGQTDIKVENMPTTEVNEDDKKVQTYILNTSSKKFHKVDCSSVPTIKEKNKDTFTGTREELIEMGYSPCGNCKP